MPTPLELLLDPVSLIVLAIYAASTRIVEMLSFRDVSQPPATGARSEAVATDH